MPSSESGSTWNQLYSLKTTRARSKNFALSVSGQMESLKISMKTLGTAGCELVSRKPSQTYAYRLINTLSVFEYLRPRVPIFFGFVQSDPTLRYTASIPHSPLSMANVAIFFGFDVAPPVESLRS